MSKISFGNSFKLRGNINRTLEMIDGGLGDNAISGVFKDEKIEISPQFVREIRLGAQNASKKALPKKVAKKAIKGVYKDKNNGSDTTEVFV